MRVPQVCGGGIGSPMTDSPQAAVAERGTLEADRLAEITDSALAYLSLEDLLGELLDRIRTILHADTAAILLLDRDRSVLVARAAKGIEEEVRQGVCIPVGG